MDICRDYGVAPFFAFILEGIVVPEKSDPTRDDTIKQWFDKVVPEGAVSYDIHTMQVRLQIVCCFVCQMRMTLRHSEER